MLQYNLYIVFFRYVFLGTRIWTMYSDETTHLDKGISSFFCTSMTIKQLSPYDTQEGYFEMFLYDSQPPIIESYTPYNYKLHTPLNKHKVYSWNYLLHTNSYVNLQYCIDSENHVTQEDEQPVNLPTINGNESVLHILESLSYADSTQPQNVFIYVVKGTQHYSCFINKLTTSRRISLEDCGGLLNVTKVTTLCKDFEGQYEFRVEHNTDRYYIIATTDNQLLSTNSSLKMNILVHRYGDFSTDSSYLVCDSREHRSKECTVTLKYRAQQSLVVKAHVAYPYKQPLLLQSSCFPRVSSYIVFFCALPMVVILAIVGIIWIAQRCVISSTQPLEYLDDGSETASSSAPSDSDSTVFTPLPTYQEAVGDAAASPPDSGLDSATGGEDQPPPYHSAEHVGVSKMIRSRSFS